jgi:hypothetical protein
MRDTSSRGAMCVCPAGAPHSALGAFWLRQNQRSSIQPHLCWWQSYNNKNITVGDNDELIWKQKTPSPGQLTFNRACQSVPQTTEEDRTKLLMLYQSRWGRRTAIPYEFFLWSCLARCSVAAGTLQCHTFPRNPLSPSSHLVLLHQPLRPLCAPWPPLQRSPWLPKPQDQGSRCMDLSPAYAGAAAAAVGAGEGASVPVAA